MCIKPRGLLLLRAAISATGGFGGWRCQRSKAMVAIGILFASPVYAQDKADQNPEPARKEAEITPPELSVSLVNDEPTLVENIEFHVTVTNPSKDVTICIDKVTVLGPLQAPDPEQVLTKGDGWLVDCIIRKGSRTLKVTSQGSRTKAGYWKALTRRSGKTDKIQTEVTFANFTPEETDSALGWGSVSNVTPIKYGNPFWVPFTGIVIGASLLIALLALGDPRPKRAPQPRPSILALARTWVAAVLSGCIVMLVSGFSTAVNLPVALEVKDLYGAIVLGLISWKLIPPLRSALGLDKETERAAGKGQKVGQQEQQVASDPAVEGDRPEVAP